MTSGIEWNYRFSSITDYKNFKLFYDTFEDLFLNHSSIIDDEELRRYSKDWHKPAVAKDLARYDAHEEDENTKVEVQCRFCTAFIIMAIYVCNRYQRRIERLYWE